MAYDVYSRHDSRIGIFPQAEWGTGAATNAAFKELANGPFDFTRDVKLRRPDRSFASTSGGQRYPDIRDVQNDNKGAAPTITISGDVRKDDLSMLLYSVMQNVSEAGTTPFLKTFTFPTTQPDFTLDGGFFSTICAWHPVASQSHALVDAIINELTFSCAPGSGDDRLQYNATFIGRGGIVDSWNPSGTWTRADEDHFYFHDLAGITAGASALDILSIEWTIANNALPVGVELDSGNFQTFALPRYSVTGKIRVLYGSTISLSLIHISEPTRPY